MNAPPVDINMRVEQYVALRDEIKRLNDEHKKKMEPYNELLARFNGELLQHLQTINSESVRTKSGTVYRTDKKSASLVDAEAFMKFVIANNEFDLLDRKANSTAVEEFIKATGAPPPGANFTITHVVGVRRS